MSRERVDLSQSSADVEQIELLRAIMAGTARSIGDEYFQTLVKTLAKAIGVRWAFVALFNEREGKVRTLAWWNTDRIVENIEFALSGTPCEDVIRGSVCHHPTGVAVKFPEDRALATNKMESYLGVPLIDRESKVIGHLAVMDDRPMPEDERRSWILRIFADRSTSELERLLMERELKKSEQQFRDLFNEAPIAYVHEDIETRFLSVNRAGMNLLGLKPEDVPGTLGISLVAPDQTTQEQVSDAFHNLREGKEHGIFELELRRKDNGHPVWVQFWSRPDPDGNFTRTMMVDITARVLAERERARLSLQNRYLQEELKSHHNFDEIIGFSEVISNVLRKVAQVAPTDSTVLITGETGTGKELIARAIHNRSTRKDRPLIKLNCAALPAGLVESELFGHEKGAFTGALDKRQGRFALANGGTIFLDEIGDMALETQAKLLRVLQEKEFEPVGSTKPVYVDVRVIAATNRNLEKAVENGTFRADLYYRLNVFPIPLPPLRERTADIPLLVNYFIQRYASKIGRDIQSISETGMNSLMEYRWPGNIRELENVIERAVILCEGPELSIDSELHLLSDHSSSMASLPSDPPYSRMTLAEVERTQILKVLEETKWVIEGPRGAAVALGLHPNTLRSRIKKMGIERPVAE